MRASLSFLLILSGCAADALPEEPCLRPTIDAVSLTAGSPCDPLRPEMVVASCRLPERVTPSTVSTFSSCDEVTDRCYSWLVEGADLFPDDKVAWLNVGAGWVCYGKRCSGCSVENRRVFP